MLQEEYAHFTDDELLQLASERSSLTDEAKAALDTELQHRNLTGIDVEKHSRAVKRVVWRETRSRNRKLFGTRIHQKSGIQTLVALFYTGVALYLIWLAYSVVPARYRLSEDWQETATYVVFCSVLLAVWFFREWGRRLAFWISLLVSSTAHALIVHTWIARIGTDMLWRSRGEAKLAMFLGLMLFFLLYGGWALVRQKLPVTKSVRGVVNFP